MTNKRKQEIKGIVSKLASVNLEFTVEDELELQELKCKEQECERLRKQYNCYACGTCIGKEDYKNMQKHCENAIAQNHNYDQALDEIQQIVEFAMDEVLTLGQRNATSKILDIIEEARGTNANKTRK